ncbi:MAG: TIGR03084 family metal-binding protein [Hyphomonadaceae bacterium]
MQQAEDFRAESDALYRLLEGVDAAVYDEPTLFKSWTINMVLEHLCFWNQMAGLQVTDEDELVHRLSSIADHDGGMRGFEADYFAGLSGPELRSQWHLDMQATADIYAQADPKRRLKWAGPEMSARSSITARLMETWAHGQEVYDHLGIRRVNQDRIRNIVVLGVNTYGWTYKTRRETIPGPMPYLRLTAPSGEIWTYGDESAENMIEGPAEGFCQTVTQTRNIADTELTVTGPIAQDWMSKAQCFAGAPETPPMPGVRHTRKIN